MRISLFGDFSENLDEGLKNIAHYTAESLSAIEEINLQKIDIKRLMDLDLIKSIRAYDPDVIHYIPGPTNKSLFLLKCIKTYLGKRPKIVLSCSYPVFDDKLLNWLHFKPDLAFAQSRYFKKRMDALGIASCLLPNGVDTDKFAPISSVSKVALRKRYGLKGDLFTILHVGHLMDKRNLGVLARLSKKFQVIFVASDYITIDPIWLKILEDAGCIIFRGYNPRIEEFYQLSDCYIFPVKPGDSICCPLSVMEAMSCNLPVITTNFEGISTFFSEGNGLTFFKKDEDIIKAIDRLNQDKTSVCTRSSVSKYSWKNNALKISHAYRALLYD